MTTKSDDRFFRMAGIAGLAALLLLVIWMRSADRKGNGSQAGASGAMSQAIEKAPAGQSEPLLPSGKLVGGVREVAYEAFRYGFDPDPLVVRAGETVRLLVKSRDVEHGMMIPEIGFNAPMPIGESKAVEFAAPEKPGEYPVYCSIYCGAEHGSMQGTLTVLPALPPAASAPAPTHSDSGGGHGHE